jgi:hypothetical protein
VCVYLVVELEFWLACVRDSSRRAVQKEKATAAAAEQSGREKNTPEHGNIAQHSGV